MKLSALIIATMVAIVATGCQSVEDTNLFKQGEKIGTANPASEYCIRQDGQLKIQKDTQGGEVGMCYLPDGQVVEEWEYFRKNNPQPS